MGGSKRARSRKRRKQPRDDLQQEQLLVLSGNRQEGNDEAVKGREESDDLVVPEDRRKAIPTAEPKRGGKGITASQGMEQLGLFGGTADQPKPPSTRRSAPSAMIMEEIASEENLMMAFERVASNKGAPGPDRQNIEDVRKHLPRLLPALHAALLDGSYRPGMIRRVWIPKPGGGRRGLGIPNVVDRLVQQAVHQVLSPHIEPTFHGSSHGFRPGRSCHTAIAEAKKHLEEGFEYVVDLDLEKFFDRVHHQRLLARLEHKGVTDRRTLQLIQRMLKAKVVMPDGVVVSTEEGAPQGGPLSPLLSNVVLDELDRELERRSHRFVRYADDCNIYVRSERAGKRVMESIRQFIEERLRLRVNADKSAVARPEERHFVGFSLRRRGKQVEILLSTRSKERLSTKIRALTPRTWGQSLGDCISRINEYLQGWIGFFWVCSKAERRTLRGIDAHIRRRLRAILLRQKKRRLHIVRWLIQLGIKRPVAWATVYNGRKSMWPLSHAPAVDRALPPAYFRDRGLIAVDQLWKARQPTIIVPRKIELSVG